MFWPSNFGLCFSVFGVLVSGLEPGNEHVLDVNLLVFGGNRTPPYLVSALGIPVSGLGFRVLGSGVWGLGLMVDG